MKTSSDRFARAISKGHSLSSTVSLLNVNDGSVIEIPVSDGTVTLDGKAATLAGTELTVVPDPDLIPMDSDDPLAPYGNVFTVSRGMRYSDTAVEELTLGTFNVDSIESNRGEGGELSITLSGLDYSQRIIDATMESSGQIPAGTTCADAIRNLIHGPLPLFNEFDFATSVESVTLPLINYALNDDRWDICQSIAEAAQCDLYFSAEGKLIARPHPTTFGSSLLVNAGEVMIEASKRWSRDESYNAVSVTVNGSDDTPVVGWAADTVANSPTKYGGPFGKKIFEWSTDYITGADEAAIQAKADAVAQTILRTKLGIAQSVSFRSLFDPRLEPFDVVQVVDEDLGLNTLHIVDSINLSLSEPAMSVETRTMPVL